MSDAYSEIQSFPSSFDDGKNMSYFLYRCEKCNTIFEYCNDEPVKECVLCHDTSIVREQVDKLDDINYIISFLKSDKDAIKNYKKAIYWNPFVPIIFKKKSTIEKIKKVYLPCYFLDAHVEGDISFYAGDKSKIKKEGKKVIETKKYDVLLNTNFDYYPFFVSTYSKLSEELFELVCEVKNPVLQEYQNSLLKDSYVIQSDIDNESIANYIKSRIQNHCLTTVKQGINHQLKKVQQNNLVIHADNIRKVLCPVYLLNVSYHGKNYCYLMNGENGRDYAQICFGKIEIFLFSLILVIFILILSYFIVVFV